MSVKTGLLILAIAFAAFIIEINLYYIVGVMMVSTGSGAPLPVFRALFVWVMIMTCVLGVGAPVAALIERSTGRKNLGWYILPPVVILIGLALGAYLLLNALR